MIPDFDEMVLRMMRYFGQDLAYWEEHLTFELYDKAMEFLIKEPPIDILMAKVHGYKAPKRKSEIKKMDPLMGLPELEP